MGEKNESGGERGGRKRPTGMVPVGERAAKHVAVQNRQGGHRQMPMWSSNDRHTCCERVPKWRPRKKEWAGWREALGMGKKKERERGGGGGGGGPIRGLLLPHLLVCFPCYCSSSRCHFSG